jgi:hypothetical protein
MDEPAVQTYYRAHGRLPPQWTPHRVAVEALRRLGRDWPAGTVAQCQAQGPDLLLLERRLERACTGDNPRVAWRTAWRWVQAWRQAVGRGGETVSVTMAAEVQAVAD